MKTDVINLNAALATVAHGNNVIHLSILIYTIFQQIIRQLFQEPAQIWPNVASLALW